MSTRKLFKENVYMKTAKAVITDIVSDEKGLIDVYKRQGYASQPNVSFLNYLSCFRRRFLPESRYLLRIVLSLCIFFT